MQLKKGPVLVGAAIRLPLRRSSRFRNYSGRLLLLGCKQMIFVQSWFSLTRKSGVTSGA